MHKTLGSALVVLLTLPLLNCGGEEKQPPEVVRQWQSPTRIDGGLASFPFALAIDAAGNAMAVWSRPDGVFAARAEKGKGWASPMRVAPGTGRLFPRQIAAGMDAQGNTLVAWNNHESVFTARHTVRAGWEAPQQIAGYDPSPFAGLSLAVQGNGDALLVWSQLYGRQSQLAYTRLTPRGWTYPGRVSQPVPVVEQPSVALAGNGDAMAVWSEVNRGIWAAGLRASSPEWTSTSPVGTDLSHEPYAHASNPQVAMDAAGNAFAVFEFGSRIWANRFTRDSGWSQPTRLDTNVGNAEDAPRIAMDSAGNPVAVWISASDAVVSSRSTAGGGWSPAAPIQSGGRFPELKSNARGNLIAGWVDERDNLRRKVAVSAFSTDSGWGTPMNLSQADRDVREFSLAVGESGDAGALWLVETEAGDELWASLFE
jgi:hypothetical protein